MPVQPAMSPVTEQCSVDGKRKRSLSVCLPQCPPTSRLLCLCFRLSVSVRVPASRLCPSAYLSVSACVCPSGCLSVSVRVPACLSECLPVFVRVSTRLCLSDYLPVSVRVPAYVCASACLCAACMPVWRCEHARFV